MVTGNWTIEAKFAPLGDDAPIVGSMGHLYVEVWDESGNRVAQFNGWPTEREDGSAPSSPGLYDDQLRVYGHEAPSMIGRTMGKTKSNHPDQGVELFSGSQEDVESAIDAMVKAATWINLQNFVYDIFGQIGFNSNSVFSALVDAMQTVIDIPESLVGLATDMGVANPGHDQVMLTDGTWQYVTPQEPFDPQDHPSAEDLKLANELNEKNALITNAEYYDEETGYGFLEYKTLPVYPLDSRYRGG